MLLNKIETNKIEFVTMALDVDSLPKVEETHERVRKRYDGLFHQKEDGTRQPLVCVVCDKFLVEEDDRCHVAVAKLVGARSALCWDSHPDERRKEAVQRHFTVGECILRDYPDLEGLALSPRAPFYKLSGSRGSWGFSCCRRCRQNVVREKKTPRHAIVNSNCVGAAPPCLSDLNEAELAFLSPVKQYGYCFTFTGGKQKCLKGTLSFMKVSRKAIAKAVGTLESMDLNENVLILYSGELTKWQKERVKELYTVRPEKLVNAVNWLEENNSRWSKVNKAEVLRDLQSKKPVVVDNSEEVEGSNSNVEKQHILTCYYPDGAVDTAHGGLERPEDFKKWVSDLASKGYQVEFKANLRKEFANESDGDLLVDCNMLQFPYGIGGRNDTRLLHDGSRTTTSDINDYLVQLSLQSQEQFQRPLFQLMLYSLLCKNELFKSSRLQLKGETDAHNLASGLNQDDIKTSIRGRRMGNRFSGTKVSNLLLDAVDATAKDLPHTNEAAKKARGMGEAMQHHFGMGSVFLTCTFDDENSLIMNVLSGEDDDGRLTEELTDAEVTGNAKKRKGIRLEYPGLAAVNFEVLFEILRRRSAQRATPFGMR